MGKVEQSHFKQSIQNQGAERASERSSQGLIGKVAFYHGNTTFCECGSTDAQGNIRHPDGAKTKLPAEERHTVDVDVLLGNKLQRLYSVPCFVYSQGLIDKGFKKNDRVFIQYINGDPKMPVATAYYREPDQLDLFFNNMKYRVAEFFDDLLPG
ncbi:hypothetical protein FU976_07965 [Campylobacter jejuni]|nr:hypothetical protein [Campylobacter jejuni]